MKCLDFATTDHTHVSFFFSLSAQIGLVRMSAFVLQTLSSDRAFGVKLNKTFDGHSSLPNSVRLPAFHGSYADFVIIVSRLIGVLLYHVCEKRDIDICKFCVSPFTISSPPLEVHYRHYIQH